MKSSFLFLSAMLVSYWLTAQQVIFPFNDVWKYLDNGTNQGTAWRQTSFNDATWQTGTGKLGYGTANINTVVSFGPSNSKKYITTYFRKTVSITNPSAYTHFAALVKRDDGLIVYVNGVEVYRNNMPAGNVTYDSLASLSASDDGN